MMFASHNGVVERGVKFCGRYVEIFGPGVPEPLFVDKRLTNVKEYGLDWHSNRFFRRRAGNVSRNIFPARGGRSPSALPDPPAARARRSDAWSGRPGRIRPPDSNS